MIQNINAAYGMSVSFGTVEQMEAHIRACGYSIPEDGLVEGRDYEDVEKVRREKRNRKARE
jgi:hypothetical protein